MIVMHSLFDPADGCTCIELKSAIQKFSEHLIAEQLLVSWRFMQREDHEGYNAEAPETKYYLAMEFTDMPQAQACWNYIETDMEPVKSLHERIKLNTSDSSFFLYSDIL